MLKIDRRKRYYLVVDTETTMVSNRAVAFDIAWAISDKMGNIYSIRNYLVEPVMLDKIAMNSQYCKNKLPRYRKMWKDKEIEMKGIDFILKAMKLDIEQYFIFDIVAYNMEFDIDAIVNIGKIYHQVPLNSNSELFLSNQLNFHGSFKCLWKMACQTIFQQITFKKEVVTKRDGLTKKGNISTRFQIAYRYIKGNWEYVEGHTAKSDVIDEVELLSKCLDQHKKIDWKKKDSWKLD